MKKTYTVLTIILLTVLLTSFGVAQNLLTEDFSLTLGNLAGQNGWTVTSGTGGIAVTTPGLSYTNVNIYQGSGIGNAVTLSHAVTETDTKSLSTTGVNTGSVYCSAMINVSETTNATGDYLISLGYDALYYANVYIRKDPTSGFNFGVSKLAYGPGQGGAPLPNPVYTSSAYNFGTTYLVVVKYTFIPGTSNDQVVLYVNPVVWAPEPGTPTLTANNTSSDLNPPGFTVVRLHQSSAVPTATIDGIRVATTWADLPMPVELSSFTSITNGRNIQLNWETKTEKNSDKFVIERKAYDTWESIGSVKSAVLSNSPKQYSYTDKNLQSGKYQYRLKMVDNDGTFRYSSTIETVVEVPNEYSLLQNYPNPFNPSTVINYSTPQDGKVTLKVFDITGKELVVLVNENQKAGHYSVNFDASRLSSGVYFYTLNSGSFMAAKKLTLIK